MHKSIVLANSSFPSNAICLLAQSRDAIKIYDGDVVCIKLRTCCTLFGLTKLLFTCNKEPWVKAPIILWVLWAQISAPASKAEVGSLSEKARCGPWASSTISGILYSWTISAIFLMSVATP